MENESEKSDCTMKFSFLCLRIVKPSNSSDMEELPEVWIMGNSGTIHPGFLDVVFVPGAAPLNSREQYSFLRSHDYFILSLYLYIINSSVFVPTLQSLCVYYEFL